MPRQPTEGDRVAHILTVRELHQMSRSHAHTQRLIALVLAHHIRRQRPVHHLDREAMRELRALPVLALEVEPSVPIGRTDRPDPVPTRRGLDDLRPERRDVHLRRSQGIVHHAHPPRLLRRLRGDVLDIALREPKSSDGSLSALMAEATS